MDNAQHGNSFLRAGSDGSRCWDSSNIIMDQETQQDRIRIECNLPMPASVIYVYQPGPISFIFKDFCFYVHGCICHMCRYRQRPEEGTRVPEAGITDDYLLPDLRAGN